MASEPVVASEALREDIMKPILAGLCAVIFLTATITYAQPTSDKLDPKTGVETTGTVREFTPERVIILDTLAPNEPTQFKLSKNVVYVDGDGKTVDSPGLRNNQKIRIHYTKRAGENVADRVTLIKE